MGTADELYRRTARQYDHPGGRPVPIILSAAVVSYSNEVKHNVLGVSEESLRLHGAVSREVVEQMALGAIRTLGCDCSVATSGVAGPGGGTP